MAPILNVDSARPHDKVVEPCAVVAAAAAAAAAFAVDDGDGDGRSCREHNGWTDELTGRVGERPRGGNDRSRPSGCITIKAPLIINAIMRPRFALINLPALPLGLPSPLLPAN